MGRGRALAVAVALAAGVAGCGGSSTLASQSADQIAGKLESALRNLHSYRLTGHLVNAQGPVSFELEVGGSNRVLVEETLGAESVELIALGQASYIKANRAYYEARGNLSPAGLDALSGRWVQVPTSSVPDSQNNISTFTGLGTKAAACLAARKGSVTKGGTTTVDGQSAVILINSGKVPGSAPGKIYVAAKGTAWPLRTEITGARRPGGPASCASSGGTVTGAYEFSDFNRPIAIRPPPSPLNSGALS